MAPPFPLRLTPLEQFFSLDDQPRYPNQIVCRLRCEGKVDRDRLERAIAIWCQRHPMIVAKLSQVGRRWNWSHNETCKPVAARWIVDSDLKTPKVSSSGMVIEDDVPALHDADPWNGESTRITVVQGPSCANIFLQTHHSSMDGIGGMQTISDLLVLYAQQFDQPEAGKLKLRRVDQDRLQFRNHFFDSIAARLRFASGSLIGLFGVAKYWFRRAIPLSDNPSTDQKNTQEPNHTRPGILSIQLRPEDTAYLREYATDSQVTVNGLLMRDLFLAVKQWQDANDVSRAKRCIRIMVPINMRSFADRRMSAANRVSMVYLDRNDRQMQRAEELLWGINFEMKVIQRLNLGIICLAMMRWMRWIPWLMKRNVRKSVCRSTCILTNLGEPFARTSLPRDSDGRMIAGDLRVDAFDLLAPIRPLTNAAFALSRYAGKTLISLHYDRQSLSADQAQAILALYASRIHRSIEQLRKQKAKTSTPTQANSK